jgi:hypothetical protein
MSPGAKLRRRREIPFRVQAREIAKCRVRHSGAPAQVLVIAIMTTAPIRGRCHATCPAASRTHQSGLMFAVLMSSPYFSYSVGITGRAAGRPVGILAADGKGEGYLDQGATLVGVGTDLRLLVAAADALAARFAPPG